MNKKGRSRECHWNMVTWCECENNTCIIFSPEDYELSSEWHVAEHQCYPTYIIMLLIVKKKWHNHSPHTLTSLIKLILDKEGGNPWPQLIQAEKLFMIGRKWMKTCQKKKQSTHQKGKKRYKMEGPQSWQTKNPPMMADH